MPPSRRRKPRSWRSSWLRLPCGKRNCPTLRPPVAPGLSVPICLAANRLARRCGRPWHPAFARSRRLAYLKYAAPARSRESRAPRAPSLTFAGPGRFWFRPGCCFGSRGCGFGRPVRVDGSPAASPLPARTCSDPLCVGLHCFSFAANLPGRAGWLSLITGDAHEQTARLHIPEPAGGA